MSKTVWKAVLQMADVQEIMVPAGAVLLCAREQFENICVWFLCDPGALKVPRMIAIVGTGHPAPDDGVHYLGTASLRDGQLMYHVFERIH